MEGGGHESDGTLLVEVAEVPYECAARSKHNIFLPKTINLIANRWYLIWARIAGPSSDCGSNGQKSVTTEEQIVFHFRTSKKANNGTDVSSGQIPSILYRVINQELKLPITNSDTDPIHKVSQHFANSVTKDCFQSLITLLKWSWGTFKLTLNDLRDKVSGFYLFIIPSRGRYLIFDLLFTEELLSIDVHLPSAVLCQQSMFATLAQVYKWNLPEWHIEMRQIPNAKTSCRRRWTKWNTNM